jgi:Uma2 family endonuclease
MNAPIVYPKLSPQALAERWNALRGAAGLPERFELDEYGEVIEMIAPKTAHQRIVWALQKQISDRLGGEALPGIAIVTSIGVRVPDVVWQPSWGDEDPAPRAPAICAEVQSEDNTRREMNEKVAAYLEAGAQEVILVDLSGRIRYFGADGERDRSAFGLDLALPPDTYPR